MNTHINTVPELSEREASWQAFIARFIRPFWQSYAHEFVVQADPKVDLHCLEMHHPSPKMNLIILPGRVESYLKYQEVCFDFFHQGCNIFSIDHRGQGQSSRLLKDPEKGHIDSFDTYAADLELALDQCGFLETNLPTHILAHSMGGAIALNWLYLYRHNIDKLVLSAPMLGINAGLLPQRSALAVARTMHNLSNKICPESPYFPGQAGYNKTLFELNPLTHSRARYEFSQQILQDHKLGGVTAGWLYEALKIIKLLPTISAELTLDILLLQAEKDLIVSLSAQDRWFDKVSQKNQGVSKRVIADAKHEILMEKDSIRAPVIEEITHFFK
ncbi:alpha/beta fold hydrolase [Gayadomonas joobiniege]|uniref:alpha/beta fold hydrolase n=1 Tax=Gayadomonas joobiniege TaxID=1234606 RepID=UPI000370D21D|nr:alpha/beta fold hydrolase [Gayadomonas joobiniege]